MKNNSPFSQMAITNADLNSLVKLGRKLRSKNQSGVDLPLIYLSRRKQNERKKIKKTMRKTLVSVQLCHIVPLSMELFV